MTKIALIGRPNVGKSTLFNRIVGKRLALVDDQPGVTRDLREASSKILGVPVTIMDTAGLESAKDGSLSARMRALTERGMKEADILVFLIDARAGVTSLDVELADLVRKSDKPTFLCANKAEGKAGEAGYFDAFTLGLGEPIAISGEHGEGVYELYQAMFPILEALEEKDSEEFVDFSENLDGELEDDDTDFEIDPKKPIHVAIVGRPNAGKSTLVNAIIGEDRLLTGPEAGITRDSIAIETNWQGQAYKLIDTAGMRKKSRVQDKVEGLSVGDSIRALKFAEVVVILVDALTPFEQQDLRIADLCEREGRAIVICANKWDLVENKNTRRQEIIEGFERLLPQIKGAPLVPISAKTGKNLDRLEAAIREVYEVWNRRVPTGQLNDWLREETQRHPPPAPKGRRIKIKYMTQAKTRPPSFVAFCTRAEELPDSYKRFLVNGLRYDFDIPGVPIRLHFKSGKNPYEKKAKQRKIH